MKQVLLSFGLMLLAVAGSAQVRSTYAFASSTTTYNDARADSVITNANDDGVFNNVSIGFNFPFNGGVYDKVAVGNNGFIALTTAAVTGSGTGSSIVSASNPSGLSLSNFNTTMQGYGYGPMIAGLNFDLLAEASISSELSLSRTGTAPNRQAIFQWKNYRKYGAAHSGDVINFQIVLNESGLVQVHYGNITYTGNDYQAVVGIRGNDTTDVSSRVGTSWTSHSPNTFAKDGLLTGASNVPAAGLLFSWTPQAPAPDDAGVTSIVKPSTASSDTTCLASLSDSVIVVVTNFGSNALSSITVRYDINGGTPVTETFTLSPALAQYQRATLKFSQPFVAASNGFTFRAYASAPNETPTTASNDTVRRVINYTNLAGAAIYPAFTSDFGGVRNTGVPDGWTQSRLSGTTGFRWEVDTAAYVDGSPGGQPLRPVVGPAHLTFDGYGANNASFVRAVSPCINMTGWNATEPVWLEFSMAMSSIRPSNIDSLIFEMNPGTGTGFTKLATYSRFDGGVTNPEWRTYAIDISNFRNSISRLGITMGTATGANMSVDYFKISNTQPTGLNVINLSAPFQVYPNPTATKLNVDLPAAGQYQKLEVLNLTGQVVASKSVTTLLETLDLTGQPSGVYIVRASGLKGVNTQRVVKH